MKLSHADTIGRIACWTYVPWGGHRRVEYVRALVALGDARLHHLFDDCGKNN